MSIRKSLYELRHSLFRADIGGEVRLNVLFNSDSDKARFQFEACQEFSDTEAVSARLAAGYNDSIFCCSGITMRLLGVSGDDGRRDLIARAFHAGQDFAARRLNQHQRDVAGLEVDPLPKAYEEIERLCKKAGL